MKQNRHGLIGVGTIVKAFGIRGECVLRPMTDTPGRFRRLRKAFIGRSEAAAKIAAVEHVAVQERGVRVKFAGVDSRSEAEKLAGSIVFVEESEAVRPPAGTFYLHQVVGLSVVDDAGNTVGVVRDVLRLPAHDVYVVENGGREMMIPAVKEFVRKIDVAGGTMTVHMIEGMEA